MPEQRPSWRLISPTVWINVLVDHSGFPLLAEINCSHSSLHTPALHYIVRWRPAATIRIYSHSISCCFLCLLLLVLRMICNWESQVIFAEAALAVLRWTTWCMRCCLVSAGGTLDRVPGDWLDSDLLPDGWGCCGAMICCCGKGEEDDNEKKWEVLRNI